jgi:hypothetical protein
LRQLRTAVKRSPRLRTLLFQFQNAGSIFRRTHVALQHRVEAKYFLAAMIRVKDEARFLPEWLAYHLNIGVEHVFIYDNNSSDNAEAVISPFVTRGFATYIKWPKTPASPSSQIDFLARFGCEAEWVAFFDADEFLFERTPGLLLDVLRRSTKLPAIAINWRYFGSSGHEQIPDGLIIENFTQSDLNLDRHVKVIARPSAIHRYRNPHNFYYRAGRLARTPDGRRVTGSFSEPEDDLPLVLRHYVYRSKADYERKAVRGFADARGAVDEARHPNRSMAEFSKHNHIRIAASPGVLHSTTLLLQKLGYDEQLYNASRGA